VKHIEYPDLEAFFQPQSMAIAWASDDPLKLGGIPLKCAIERGYQGKIFPVNPKREIVQGIKAYPSILDIPEDVDVALLVMRADDVADVLWQCVKKRVKAAVIPVVGFAEIGGEGKKRQDEIVEICKSSGIRICGPNTNGLANVREGVTLGYSYAQEVAIPGRLGYVSQSGALLSATVPRFVKTGIGLSYFVASGNQADLDTFDYIKYMLDDPDTDVIAAYIEGLKNVDKFLDIADLSLEKGKPLIVLKVGRSEEAAKAAMAHTASMVGSDLVFDAICKQKGIIRVDDFDNMMATSLAFLNCKLPKGDRIGVLSTSGAATGIIADHAMNLGLHFPQLSTKTMEEASKILPGWPASGEMKNFWDIASALPGRMPDLSKRTIELFVRDENFDIIIAVSTPIERRAGEAVVSALVQASKETEKPIILLSPMGGLLEREVQIIAESNIPVVADAADCVKATAALIKYSQSYKSYKETKVVTAPLLAGNVKEVKQFSKSGGKTLSEHASKEFLYRYGIPITAEAIAKSVEEAVEIAGRIGYPLVLKVDSPDIIHKTDAGAIKLNISNEAELISAYYEVLANSSKYEPKAKIRGVLVQEMVKEGREVIVGMSHDPQFGPVIIFGLGGIFTEVLKDFSLRVAPIAKTDAEQMIKEIKGYKTLEVFRGKPQADLESIIDTLLKLSKLCTDLGHIVSEIDINPLMVLDNGKGVKVADALVVLS